MFDFNFDWNDELNLGVQSIDTQHRALLKIGRDIEQLLTIRCIGVSNKQLLDIICDLREYSSYHFYEEEQLMIKAGYEDLDAHIKEHNTFRKMIVNINCPAMAQNAYPELKKLKTEIQDWIFGHMMKADKQMVMAIGAERLNELDEHNVK